MQTGCSVSSGIIRRIKAMIRIQKEERKQYHAKNELHMKEVLHNTIQKEFRSRGEVVVVVNGEKEDTILPIEERESLLNQFCDKAMANVSTRMFLSELLAFFEKQLKSMKVCESAQWNGVKSRLILNDAVFTLNGEKYLK